MPRNVNSSSSAEARDSRSYQSSSYPPISDDTDSMAHGAEHVGKMFPQVSYILQSQLSITGENRRFDRCILDWTNQCKSRLQLVAKSAFLQTATTAHISGPIYEAFFCSGSLKPGSFGYLGQMALALIGPI